MEVVEQLEPKPKKAKIESDNDDSITTRLGKKLKLQENTEAPVEVVESQEPRQDTKESNPGNQHEDSASDANDISEILKMITDEKLIGNGSGGDVYGPFSWRKQKWAIKQIVFEATEDMKKFRKEELDLWTKLSHENLIKIQTVCLDVVEGSLMTVLNIFMEYLGGDTLRNALNEHGSLPISVVDDWAKQISNGMSYLHERNIVHRDLKSHNVLLTKSFDPSNANDKITLKIGDFDEMREHSGTETMTFKGTYGWMAPEVLQHHRFSKSSDVWSYGVVVWEMLTGDLPHKGVNIGDLSEKAKSEKLALPLPAWIPETFYQLLKCCFRQEKNNRPTFHNINDIFRSTAMPTEDGMSNDDIKRQIYSKASPFICGVDPYLLIQPLFEENVITTEEWQQIEKEYESKRQRCRLLYNHLKRSTHPRAFLIVKETLEKHGHPFLNELHNVPSTSNGLDIRGSTMSSIHDGVNEHSAIINDQVKPNINSSLQERVENLEKERDEARKERDEARGQLTDLKQRVETMEALLIKPGKRRRTADPSKQTMKRHHENTSVAVYAIGRISMPYRNSIRGVAKLNESIYILCKYQLTDSDGYSSVIRVYEDQNTFRFQKEIPLNGIEDAWELVSCDKSKCLYVDDGKEKCIWIVSPAANDYQIEKWFSYDSDSVSLSVSKNGHLLVHHVSLCVDQFVEIYDGYSRALVRNVHFPDDIKNPDCAFEERNGQVIILHGSKRDGPCIISQMNIDGKEAVRSKLQRSPKLSDDCCFCFDSLNFRLFVADGWKKQVHVIFAESVQYAKTLLKRQDIDNDKPGWLCYDEEKHQLIICFDSETTEYVRIFGISNFEKADS